jgi:hypothetical protein
MSDAPPPAIPPSEPGAPGAASPVTSTTTAPTAPRPNGLGVAALILGIVAILGAAFPIINIFSAVLAVIGLILGIIGLTRKGAAKGTSIAGTIISAVAIIIVIISSIIVSLGLAVLDEALDEPGPIEETTEPLPAPDDETAIPEGDPGSFSNPVPLGVPVTFTINDVDTWVVTVEQSVLDADDLVAAADPANPVASEGSQFALLNAQFEHVAEGTATPARDLAIFFATEPGVYYLESDTTVTVPEPSWLDIVDIQRASIGGNAVVLIPAGASGVWGVSPVGTDLLIYFATQ